MPPYTQTYTCTRSGDSHPHNPSSLPCSEGVLLEELDNVNTLSNVMAMYSDNMNNQRKAGLTEGQVLHNQRQPSWAGGVKSRDTNTQFNPCFNPTEACLKTPTAIFPNQRVWENQVFDGLRIEIICSQANECLKLMANAMDTEYCPKLDTIINGANGTGIPKETVVTKVWCSVQINLGRGQIPFRVGEKLKLMMALPKSVTQSSLKRVWIVIKPTSNVTFPNKLML